MPEVTSPDLFSLLTVTEASSLFFVSPDTIRYHMDKGHLVYRKTGKGKQCVHLITFQSLVTLWGIPKSYPNL